MGILNVTPDSFSDGGLDRTSGESVARGLRMIEAGAAIIDIGGESTRPGAGEVSVGAELDRILPVIEGLRGRGAKISVDTRHAAVMRAAFAAGVDIINDVTALTHDPEAAGVVAAAGAPVVLMHMRGDPGSMDRHAVYQDVAVEVTRELAARIALAEAAGIAREAIAVDPGVGFAKNADQSAALLRRLALLANLGCPILLGASRKRFVGHFSGAAQPSDRLGGSVAAALAGVARGARILRVHDVAETVQALRMWRVC
jgi:dihydropteroate synthase